MEKSNTTVKIEESKLLSLKKVCFLCGLKDKTFILICKLLNLSPVYSEDGKEYLDEESNTIFVIKSFDNYVFRELYRKNATILGPTALKQLLINDKNLKMLKRPLYNWSMTGVVLCFTGFRDSKQLLNRLAFLAHSMGASVRRYMSKNVTHLISNIGYGEKYNYAIIFGLPIMKPEWILTAWDLRDNSIFSANFSCFLNMYKLDTFHDCKVCFYNFTEKNWESMTKLVVANGGTIGNLDDLYCTHIVVSDSTKTFDIRHKHFDLFILKEEWFWLSVQKGYRLNESQFSYCNRLRFLNLQTEKVKEETLPISEPKVIRPLPSNAKSKKKKRRSLCLPFIF